MDAHPTGVEPQLGSQLVGAHRTSQTHQSGEQAGTSRLGQGVTRTVGRCGSHPQSFS